MWFDVCVFQLETGFKEGLGKALKEYSSDAEKLKAFDGLQHNVSDGRLLQIDFNY